MKPFSLGALAAASALTLASVLPAQAQIVIQPVSEATSKDTKISNDTPTSNFSSNLNLTSAGAHGYFLSLVQFDLSPLAGLDPASVTAFLRLYSNGIGVSGLPDAQGGTVTVSPILGSWREEAADPGSAPLATYDNFFGLDPTLSSGEAVASQSVTGAGFVTWDITSLVQSWMRGTQENDGVLLQITTANGDIGFADTDSSPTVAGSAPSLVVVPEPSAGWLGVAGWCWLLARRRFWRADLV